MLNRQALCSSHLLSYDLHSAIEDMLENGLKKKHKEVGFISTLHSMLVSKRFLPRFCLPPSRSHNSWIGSWSMTRLGTTVFGGQKDLLQVDVG